MGTMESNSVYVLASASNGQTDPSIFEDVTNVTEYSYSCAQGTAYINIDLLKIYLTHSSPALRIQQSISSYTQ